MNKEFLTASERRWMPMSERILTPDVRVHWMIFKSLSKGKCKIMTEER